MRRLLALVPALFGLALTTAAAPPRDWRDAVTRTPAGAYVIGNPAARAKLVEYGSYTCSHCADFSRESSPVLKDAMVRNGSASLEYRHLVRDGVDLAAAILARCTGPRGFFTASQAIFAGQDQWLARAFEFQEANGSRIASYPRLAQLRALADGSGLTALVQARGLSGAQVDACFADQAEIDRIIAMTRNAPASVQSTPSFLLNGEALPPGGWKQIETALRARGAR